jgi:hypothetical protein
MCLNTNYQQLEFAKLWFKEIKSPLDLPLNGN